MEVHHHPHVGKKNFKEYLLEGLMIFVAVTLGFFAESLRESIVNNEREEHYVKSILRDLQNDTANISQSLHIQQMLIGKMESVLALPIESLKDIPVQDSLYTNLVSFYASFWIFVSNRNTETQLKNAGGFSTFGNQQAMDSISEVYYFYDAWIKINSDGYVRSYEKTVDLAMQLFRLPSSDIPFDDAFKPALPPPGKIVIQLNSVLLEQLYGNIRYQKGQLVACMELEKEYRRKVDRLLIYLQKEYTLN